MLDEYTSFSLVGQHFIHYPMPIRIQMLIRLIQDKDIRIPQKRSSQGHFLQFSPGKLLPSILSDPALPYPRRFFPYLQRWPILHIAVHEMGCMDLAPVFRIQSPTALRIRQQRDYPIHGIR